MVKMFADSMTTKLFSITYILDVYVKHQSKLEFGMGNSVAYPIEVKSGEVEQAWMATKEQTWFLEKQIQSWMPAESYPVVNLNLTKGSDGKFVP